MVLGFRCCVWNLFQWDLDIKKQLVLLHLPCSYLISQTYIGFSLVFSSIDGAEYILQMINLTLFLLFEKRRIGLGNPIVKKFEYFKTTNVHLQYKYYSKVVRHFYVQNVFISLCWRFKKNLDVLNMNTFIFVESK